MSPSSTMAEVSAIKSSDNNNIYVNVAYSYDYDYVSIFSLSLGLDGSVTPSMRITSWVADQNLLGISSSSDGTFYLLTEKSIFEHEESG